MSKVIYYLRVLLISYEFVALILFWMTYLYYRQTIDSFVVSENINKDALKWLVIYPVGLATWMLKEGVSILFPNEIMSKILHEWTDYWQLKAHFNVGVFYAVFLSVPCIYVWATNNLTTGWGGALFLSCTFSISLAAFSFYQAKLKIKELLINAK